MSPTQEQPNATESANERREIRKFLLLIPWGLSVWMIVGPLLHERQGRHELPMLLFLSFLPLFGVLGGIQALLFPASPRRWPLPIGVGVVSTLLFLSAAPASFRLSWLNFEDEPHLIVATSVGVAMAIAYLIATVIWWRSRVVPPNKSLERAREK